MTPSAAEASEIRERRVQVDGNRVACWRIGTVDLDRCRECQYLLRLEEIAGRIHHDTWCARIPLSTPRSSSGGSEAKGPLPKR